MWRSGASVSVGRGVACAVVVVCGALGVIAPGAFGLVLPDHRGWELVSPVDKNGGDVLVGSAFTRAAADGGAAEFASLTGFGDVRGTGILTEYESVRDAGPGTSGWSTHAITPGGLPPLSPFDEVLAGFQPRYMGMFSSDLSQGVFIAHAPLTSGSPFTASTPNIYLRDDLRSAGTGHYQLLSDCPGCTGVLPGSPTDNPAVAGASADFSHVVFESAQSLTADVPACDPGPFGNACPLHLYESVNGAVRLVGILPADEGGGPAPNSQAGQTASFGPVNGYVASYTPNIISQDGRRVFFTVRGASDTRAGQLYMRQDGTSTVRINASEKTAPDAPDAVPLDAKFWMATPDGSKVLFSTKENLINGDTTTEGTTDLYLYNVDAPAGHHLSLVSIDQEPSDGSAANVDGAVGMSDDGNTVYFVSAGQLAAGGPTTGPEQRLYVWHNAGSSQSIHEVGDVSIDQAFVIAADWLTEKRGYVSADGRFAVFAVTGDGSTAELRHSGNGDACSTAGGCREVYVYDRDAQGGAGGLTCVSCRAGNPDAPSLTPAGVTSNPEGTGLASAVVNRPLSADGRFVFFDTGDALVPEDKNQVSDVYEYDTATGGLHLLSSGAVASLGSHFMDASANGQDAFFVTRDRLVGWDTDQQYDLYDARVDGGVPDPAPTPVACTADACRGALQPGASFAAPATSGFTGAGNVKAAKHKPKPKRCAKGRVRKRVHGKVRCVKKPRAHRARVVTRASARKGR